MNSAKAPVAMWISWLKLLYMNMDTSMCMCHNWKLLFHQPQSPTSIMPRRRLYPFLLKWYICFLHTHEKYVNSKQTSYAGKSYILHHILDCVQNANSFQLKWFSKYILQHIFHIHKALCEAGQYICRDNTFGTPPYFTTADAICNAGLVFEKWHVWTRGSLTSNPKAD